MTKEELAQELNGGEYGREITATAAKEAKESGLLVIFGASDDLCELRGVIDDEVSSYDGTTLLIDKNGLILLPIERDDIEVLEKHHVLGHVKQLQAAAIKVEVLWCKSEEYSWTFETSIPHAAFDIMEGDEKYCRGIVIDLKASQS